MSGLVVVGSGASGVHYALTALRKGHRVTLVDVGHRRPEPVAPDATFLELRTALDDPVSYFLGERGQGVVYPGSRATYYGLPPSKDYVFRTPGEYRTRSSGIEPTFSFARGGLAEAWTAGAYCFHDADLADFPIGFDDLRPHYAEVAARIGVTGAADDLAPFLPLEGPQLPPLDPDPHSAVLLARYVRARERLNRRPGFYLGRSRVATLSRDHGDRKACARLGRCLWGCPIDAIYSPRHTLAECLAHPGFDYRPGLLVRHFEVDDEGRVRTLVADSVEGNGSHRIPVERLVLAAGALASTRIVLESIHRRTGELPRATGLMDNRQIHVPFLSLARIGASVDTADYQFHHLAFGLPRPDPRAYVHGQITTLRAASVHPIVQNLPLDLRTALAVFRQLRAGLAVANVNLHDTRRETSWVGLRPDGEGRTELVLHYEAAPKEEAHGERAVADVKRALRRLGCFVPPGMTRTLPKGASVHYAGTLPMTAEARPLATRPDGASWDFPNLYVVDGAVLSFLPAKNHTFTLMANATRVAELTLD